MCSIRGAVYNAHCHRAELSLPQKIRMRICMYPDCWIKLLLHAVKPKCRLHQEQLNMKKSRYWFVLQKRGAHLHLCPNTHLPIDNDAGRNKRCGLSTAGNITHTDGAPTWLQGLPVIRGCPTDCTPIIARPNLPIPAVLYSSVFCGGHFDTPRSGNGCSACVDNGQRH